MVTRSFRSLRWIAPIALVSALAVRGISSVHQPDDLGPQQIVVAGDPMTATVHFTGGPVSYSLNSASGIVNYSGSLSGSSGTITVPTSASAPGGTATICLTTDGTVSVCRNITVEK